MKSLRLAMTVALLVLWTAVGAQEFVFVSDRIMRDGGKRFAGKFHSQNEIFLYRDGSELRLTNSPDRHEYEPVVSPDGRRIVFAYQDAPHPRDEALGWRWHFGIIDALLGEELTSWEVPGSEQMTGPAGGFKPTWLPDGQSFLAQVPGQGGTWTVHRFTLGRSRGEQVASGYGLSLSPDGTRLATTRNGIVYVTDLASGRETALTAGDPLGWYDDRQVFVAASDALELVDAGTARRQVVFEFYGFYDTLALSPDGAHYAFVLLQDEQWFIVIADREHAFVEDYLMPGAIYGLDWLDGERMIFAFEKAAGDLGLATLDLQGNDPFISDSWADDFQARAVPRRPSGVR